MEVVLRMGDEAKNLQLVQVTDTTWPKRPVNLAPDGAAA